MIIEAVCMLLSAITYLVVALNLLPIRHRQLGNTQLPLKAGLCLLSLGYARLSGLQACLGLCHRPAATATAVSNLQNH